MRSCPYARMLACMVLVAAGSLIPAAASADVLPEVSEYAISAMPYVAEKEIIAPDQSDRSWCYYEAIIEANKTGKPVMTEDFTFDDPTGIPTGKATDDEPCNIDVVDEDDIELEESMFPSSKASRTAVLYDPNLRDEWFEKQIGVGSSNDRHTLDEINDTWRLICNHRACEELDQRQTEAKTTRQTLTTTAVIVGSVLVILACAVFLVRTGKRRQ